MDSLSLVKTLETMKFDKDFFLFTVGFASSYTNIPVQDAINSIQEFISEYKKVSPSVQFIVA